MQIADMIKLIETSGQELTWKLVDEEIDAVSRLKMRKLFFEALEEMQGHFE